MGRNNESPRGQKKLSKSKMYYQKQFRNQRGGGRGGDRGGGRGGWGRGGQNSSGNWSHGPRKNVLGAGMKGFLCTTNDHFEKQCVKEASNILNEYFAVIDPSLDKGPEKPLELNANWKDSTSAQEDKGPNAPSKLHDDDDVEAAMRAELKELNSEAVVKRFQPVDSGARNVIFISSNVYNNAIYWVEDPVSMVHKIFEDVYEKKQQKSMHLLRLLPVEATCRVENDEIKKTALEIFPKYFKEGFNSFSIVYNRRNNDKAKRDEIISILGDCVTEINKLNYVDLKNPNFSIIVEIIRNFMCLSVVRDYAKFKKYNLLEVGIDEETRKQIEIEEKRKRDERMNEAKKEIQDEELAEAINEDQMTTSPIRNPEEAKEVKVSTADEEEMATSPIVSAQEGELKSSNATNVEEEDDDGGIQLFSNQK